MGKQATFGSPHTCQTADPAFQQIPVLHTAVSGVVEKLTATTILTRAEITKILVVSGTTPRLDRLSFAHFRSPARLHAGPFPYAAVRTARSAV